MLFSEIQAQCLSVMDLPLWRLRQASDALFMQATHAHFQLATTQPANSPETALWKAILDAIQIDSSEEVIDVAASAWVLGQNDLPSLSEMLEHPEKKAILWQRLRQ